MGTPMPEVSVVNTIVMAILLPLLAISEAEKLEELELELAGPFSGSHDGAFVIPNPVNEELLDHDRLHSYVPSSTAGLTCGLARNFAREATSTTSKLWKNYDRGRPKQGERLASFCNSTSFNLPSTIRLYAYFPPPGDVRPIFLKVPDISRPLNHDEKFLNWTKRRDDSDLSSASIAVEHDTNEHCYESIVRDREEQDQDGNDINSTRSSTASKESSVGKTSCRDSGQWNLTVSVYKSSNKLIKIITGVGVPGLILLSIGIGCLTWKRACPLFVRGAFIHFWWKNKELKTNDYLLPLQSHQTCTQSPLKTKFGCEFSLNDLKKAAGNFGEKNKIGEGHFGVFYSGVLPKDGIMVAIKMFFHEDLKDQDDFLSELSIIHGLHHPNVVPLLGWCHKNSMWLMVYEYMPNGSLDKYLYNGATMQFNLNWQLRHRIIKGVASALAYLHSDFREQVVHGDLKPSNIMLDCDFNAHVGDFGFSCGLENKHNPCGDVSIKVSRGYIAPECLFTHKATCQGDIYSFGAVVLEVICGRHIQTSIEGFNMLVDWVWWLHRQGCILEAVDETLVLSNDYSPEEAERLLLLGLACSHPIASERPKTQDLIDITSGKNVVHIPAFKPAFVWHSTAGPDTHNTMNIEMVVDTPPGEASS